MDKIEDLEQFLKTKLSTDWEKIKISFDAFKAGLPASSPIDKWLETVIDDFDVDEWTVEGKIVIYEGEGEDDFTVEFTYGDYGTQESVVFKDKDGNEVYRKESIGMIPGYEVTILLAVAAISTIGLIYVIKKKKL